MSLAPTVPLAEVTAVALRVLLHEMGAVNTARFLNQYGVGLGDSVAEKEALMGGMNVAEIAAAIKASKSIPPTPNGT